MVWIHGGSFDHGATSSEVFNGTRFAQDGVVLVSIAYRLGVFGFLAHPELRQESGKSSGAYGLEDQIAALQWVKRNIHRFGGDPERVTVFGVSAGGIAISLLAGSSAARGLFQRAISESGGAFGPPTKDPLLSLEYAENVGKDLFKRLGAADIQAARHIPTEKVLKAASEGKGLKFWAVLDGELLRAPNAEAYRAGRFNDVPILIGFNSGEGAGNAPSNTTAKSFSEIGKDAPAACAPQIAAVLALYSHETDANNWTWARLHALYGHSKVFLYYFDVSPPDSTVGAYHGAETPYVFGRPSATARIEDAQVSQLMRRYWINFAKSADPNGPGLPIWPAFSDNASDAMIFDRNSSARRLPNVDRMRAIGVHWIRTRRHAIDCTMSSLGRPDSVPALVPTVFESLIVRIRQSHKREATLRFVRLSAHRGLVAFPEAGTINEIRLVRRRAGRLWTALIDLVHSLQIDPDHFARGRFDTTVLE